LKWTRSSQSAPDPLAPGEPGFAHRGLHGPDIPENSLPAFAAAIESGIGIETDLRLTADDRIVLFHDADSTRMCGSPAAIGRSTLDSLARLRVAGQPIPTLPDLFRLADGRVPLLLEVKVDGDLWRWVPALQRELAGYAGPFAVMSFDPRLARLLKTNMPHVRRGLLIEADLPPFRRRVYLGIAAPQFLAIEQPAVGSAWAQQARQRLPVYAWTIRSPDERAQAEVHSDALIWEGDGRPRI
jgi:glycerophosphoryl diester phosphodiesterase